LSIARAFTMLPPSWAVLVLASCTARVEPGKPASPQPAAAPNVVPSKTEVEQHRTAAGDLDGTGWYPATSTKGGFSVKLPAKFNDFTILAPTGDGATVTTCVVGTKDGDRSYSAFRATRSDGKIQEGSLEAVAERFLKENRLKARRPIAFNGLPGLELEIGDATASATIRCFTDRGTLYQLIVEYPSDDADVALHADIGRFLDSLEIPGTK
jgi:hypothetical protein